MCKDPEPRNNLAFIAEHPGRPKGVRDEGVGVSVGRS